MINVFSVVFGLIGSLSTFTSFSKDRRITSLHTLLWLRSATRICVVATSFDHNFSNNLK